MPTTTTARKAKPAKKRSEFQRIITPKEMIEEMKRISSDKHMEIAFLRRVGLTVPYPPKKKARVRAS